jgi:TonB family protein
MARGPAPRLDGSAAPRQEGTPTALLVALSVSVVGHVIGLGLQLALGWRITPLRGIRADRLDVVYEDLGDGALSAAVQERLQQAGQDAPAPSATAPPANIRIPDRALLGLLRSPGAPPEGDGAAQGPGASELGPGGGVWRPDDGVAGGADTGALRSPVVDLTNLIEAAQGDPVLLSYFSAIREQIQQTANGQTWLAADQAVQGVVYLSFVLSRDGAVDAIAVLPDRSVRSRPLQEIGLSIIKAASPFPAFPPSLGETSKTVVVPLEFLVGS